MRRLPHHDGGNHEILVVPQQPHEHIVLEDVIVIHQQRPAWPAVEVVEGPFYDTVAHNGQRPAAGGLPNSLVPCVGTSVATHAVNCGYVVRSPDTTQIAP